MESRHKRGGAPRTIRGLARSRTEHVDDQLRVGISLLSQEARQLTGTATYVRELVAELGRNEELLRLEVLCNEHGAAHWPRSKASRISVRRAAGFRIGDRRYARVAALIAASAAPGRLARQFSADVNVVHYPLTLMIPEVRLPTVTTIHDLQHLEMPHLFSRRELAWRRHFYESKTKLATMVITVSRYSRCRIVELLGIAPDRVVTIHEGVDHDRFRPELDAHEEAFVTELQLPSRYLFYPAGFWRHKNHLALLEAVARTGDDTLHVLLTGAPFGRLEEIMSYAAARGLEGRVRHLGIVRDAVLPVLYRHATAVAFPSKYEGFGLPPLEAMACGCPVASSRAASLAEVCGDAAAVLDPDDSEQMAQSLSAVVGDEHLRRQLRKKGFDHARRFSWKAAADAHLAAYCRAVEIGD